MISFKLSSTCRRSPTARLGLLLAAVLCGVATLCVAVAPVLQDVLDVPAKMSPLALKSPLLGIAAAGDKVVAVGVRGTVLRSADAGTSWTQVTMPVSADLTSVRFTSGDTAWAIGHDAAVLRSDDAGQTWARVLDGRGLFTLMTQHYRKLASGGNEEATRIVAEVEGAAALSATPGVLPYAFFDIWMGADGEGFLAGAFGFLLHTSDAGKTWEPWLERAENDRRMHLYALEQGADGELYLVGEQGLVRRYDRKAARFVTVETPYNGTFFGLKSVPAGLIAYGLRGNAFLSADGARSWAPIDLGSEATVVATLAPNADQLVFVTRSGQVLLSKDGGKSVADQGFARNGDVLAAAMVGNDQLALARINGVQVVRLTPR